MQLIIKLLLHQCIISSAYTIKYKSINIKRRLEVVSMNLGNYHFIQCFLGLLLHRGLLVHQRIQAGLQKKYVQYFQYTQLPLNTKILMQLTHRLLIIVLEPQTFNRCILDKPGDSLKGSHSQTESKDYSLKLCPCQYFCI